MSRVVLAAHGAWFNFFKIKNVCSAEGTVKKMKGQATDWEKIFAKDASD